MNEVLIPNSNGTIYINSNQYSNVNNSSVIQLMNINLSVGTAVDIHETNSGASTRIGRITLAAGETVYLRKNPANGIRAYNGAVYATGCAVQEG